MELVKNEKTEIVDERIHTNPDPKVAGQEGVEKITAFLEGIGFPTAEARKKAREIWDLWFNTGHWWEPDEIDILAFLEGEL